MSFKNLFDRLTSRPSNSQQDAPATDQANRPRPTTRVAIMNGVAVYADKDVDSINNDAITFTDGTSCNVRTGVVNDGGAPGSIVLEPNDDRADQAKATTRPAHFATKKLMISDVSANLVIRVSNEPGMTVTMTGPQASIDAIEAEASGGTLIIEQRARPQLLGDVHYSNIRAGRDVHISNLSVGGVVRGNIIIGGDVVMSNGPESREPVTMTVTVPLGTKIAIENLNGEAVIGDVEGDLKVKAAGHHTLVVGSMAKTSIEASGDISVTMAYVTGPLTCELSGTCQVDIKAGNVTSLLVESFGACRFHFGGVAETANLSATGASHIQVVGCNTEPKVHRYGASTITVGRP